MKNSISIVLITTGLIFLLFISCAEPTDPSIRPEEDLQNNWNVEHISFLKDGGVGKDGIPALENPEFVSKNDISYLADDDLVIVVKFGDKVKAYPHAILDWHEIANDVEAGTGYAVIYCPLTGTGVTWSTLINGSSTTFGVSGLLYNSNIIPYDRQSESNWSQMLGQSVNGKLTETIPDVVKSIEMSWRTCKELFPDVQVLSTKTGHSRRYGSYPYISVSGDYRVENYVMFPVSSKDDRKQNKERVFGIISGEFAKIYDFSKFESTNIINDTFKDQNYVLVGSQDKNYITAFSAISNTLEHLTFTPCDCSPGIMTDQNGNKYNIFGEVIEGDILSYQLPVVNGYVGYWFAWAAFYPELTLYE